MPTSINQFPELSTNPHLAQVLKAMSTTTSIDDALQALVEAQRVYRYDQFVTAKPKRERWVPEIKTTSSPVTPALVADSFRGFMLSMVSGGWDASQPVWFARREELPLTVHDYETAIHRELVGIRVPDVVVKRFAAQAHEILRLRDAVLVVVQAELGIQAQRNPYARGVIAGLCDEALDGALDVELQGVSSTLLASMVAQAYESKCESYRQAGIERSGATVDPANEPTTAESQGSEAPSPCG